MVGCRGLYLGNKYSDIFFMDREDFKYISNKAFREGEFRESIRGMFIKLDVNFYVSRITEEKNKFGINKIIS